MTDRRITIATCLLLALATVVAATSSGLDWRHDPAQLESRSIPDGERQGSGETGSEDIRTPDRPTADEGRDDFRLTLPGVFAMLLLLAAAVLAVAILARLKLGLRRRRRLAPGGLRGAAGSLLEGEGPDEEELARVLRTRIRSMGEGSPRNAIVAAWISLEQVAERAGVPHLPADTSTDFALRMLSTHTVDRDALEELAALFREARFSTHDLTERHRSQARECLAHLRLQLGGAVR